MIYLGTSSKCVAIQRKDHSYQTFPIVSHWTAMSVPIHTRHGTFKPIGPTILVEWEDG